MASFKFVFGVLFGLVVATIAALAIISYQNNRTSLKTAELVRYTHHVLDQTNGVASLFKDIQLESNTYYVNRDSSLIIPYLSAREEIGLRLKALKSLTADSPRQQARIDSLQLLVEELTAFTNTGLDAPRQYGMADLNTRVIRNFQYRQQIGAIIESIKKEEEYLLMQREHAYKLSVAAFNRTSFLLLAGIGVLLAVTFFVVRYSFNRRIRMQEDLRKANELFVKLFYESPIGIVISNLKTGVIIDCNNEFTNLLRFNKSEVLGMTPDQLNILVEDGERKKLMLAAKVRMGVHDMEIQLRPKDSDPVWVSVSMQRIQINNENCLLSAILDMTVHKQAEEKIKQALAGEIELNKLKSNFVSLASHEFRTPLTAVLSSASLIERYSVGANQEKIAKHITRIKAAVNLLTSILNEFLSLSKIEEGKLDPKVEMINLRETVEASCQNLMTFAKPEQKIIYTHSGEERIYSDPVLLGNIVNNLLSNAIKYSGENAEIHVTSNVNSDVHLSVKDSGIGISRQDQEHLFERFFRASNAGNIPGTGLGLHIMKHYVDLLNGEIDVKSEPGAGSEFKITFKHFKPAD